MTTTTIGSYTVITLTEEFPNLDALLAELGIDKFFLVDVFEARNAGVQTPFIATNKVLRWSAGTQRWLNHWGGLVAMGDKFLKGDNLVLAAPLELAREVAKI